MSLKLCFYQRLALILVASFMLVLGLFFWATSHFQTITKHEAEQQLHIKLAEHLVEEAPLLRQGLYNYDALKNLFHTLMILGPDFEFYYLDPNGGILTYSAETDKVKRQSVDLTPIQALLSDTPELPIYADDPKDIDRQKIFSAAPVYKDNQLQGYLYVIIGGEIYDSIVEGITSSQGMRQFALFVISGLSVLLVALLVLFRYITMPLKRLSEDVEQFRAANFRLQDAKLTSCNWCRESENEVHKLGCVFDEMLLHIDDQFQQLQQIDEHRRVLLADLSHDLRTPLANLQGYIETLKLQSDTLSVQDRQRFVDISLKNAKNLKRLIDQIFELAYLEGGQVTLNQEPFPLGEFLHDVAAKFALKAQDKEVELKVASSQFDFHVFADIGKLERVLTNLIENAIRHTPSGGRVELSVSNLKDKLRVDIRDSGVGISEKEIAFIFDARYQASNTQKDASLHAGLGLAISRKLMHLLDSDLTVNSQVGKGTCFSFELAIAQV